MLLNSLNFRHSFASFFLLILSACTSGYQIKNDQCIWVSYDEGAGKRVLIVEDSDIESFTILDNPKYAIDKNHVYIEGRMIPDAISNSFEIINDRGYSKDANHVFLDEEKVVLANPSTFQVLTWPYSKDDTYIFCGNIPMNVSSIDEFEVDKDYQSSKIRSSKSSFIESNPEYQWLDTTQVRTITIAYGNAHTKKEKYSGFRKAE